VFVVEDDDGALVGWADVDEYAARVAVHPTTRVAVSAAAARRNRRAHARARFLAAGYEPVEVHQRMRAAIGLLGVDHKSLRRWIASGDLPVIHTADGNTEVPVASVIDLYEAVDDTRREGSRKRHVLEPSLTAGRRHADSIRPTELVGQPDAAKEPAGGHRRAERRSLAYHRALAKRLRRPMADEALRLLWKWRDQGSIDGRYAGDWERLLRRPVPESDASSAKTLNAGAICVRTLRLPACSANPSDAVSTTRSDDLMHRSDFDHVLAAAAQVSEEDDLVVIGSQAILGSHPEAPASLLVSLEVDVYPRSSPQKADLIDGALGDGSARPPAA
jgi:hypothetical protein